MHWPRSLQSFFTKPAPGHVGASTETTSGETGGDEKHGDYYQVLRASASREQLRGDGCRAVRHG